MILQHFGPPARNIWPFGIYFYADLSKMDSRCQKENLEGKRKNCLPLKIEFIIFIGYLVKCFRHFDRKLQLGYQNCILHNQRKFLIFFLNNYNSSIIFRQWAKTFRPLTKNLSACSWILHSTCPEEAFAENEKNVFVEIKSLSSSSDKERKLFGFLAKKTQQEDKHSTVFRSAPLCPAETLDDFFCGKMGFLSVSEIKRFFSSGRKSSVLHLVNAFRYWEERFENYFLCRETFFHFFGILIEKIGKFWPFRQKKFEQGSKNCILRVQLILLIKNSIEKKTMFLSFSDSDRIFFFWQKVFVVYFRNCFILVQRNVLKSTFYVENPIFLLFETVIEKVESFCLPGKKLWAGF